MVALRKYRRAGLRAIGRGLLATLVSFSVIAALSLSEESSLFGVMMVPVIFGWMAIAVGVWTQVRTLRIRSLFGREGWVERLCRFRVAPGGANGQPALFLPASDGRDEAVLGVSTTKNRWPALVPCDGSDVWLVGNPQHWVVVAPPGPGELIIAKRPFLGWWRRKLRTIATTGGWSGTAKEGQR